MKKSLLLTIRIIILLISAGDAYGQIIVLTENFSGFISGSHSTPSTFDVSASLDLKTASPGWSGSLIYSAGGEVKIGTSGSTGWIETPQIDLSGNDGKFILEFDIVRWSGDATTVQVYMNDNPIGNVITPTDNYERIIIDGTDGISLSRIKITGLTKRFFLDNLIVKTENLPTAVSSTESPEKAISVFPVPASSYLTLRNIQRVNVIEIHDIAGRTLIKAPNYGESYMTLDISHLRSGVYIVYFFSERKLKPVKILKI